MAEQPKEAGQSLRHPLPGGSPALGRWTAIRVLLGHEVRFFLRRTL
jgi:hypothetical protein